MTEDNPICTPPLDTSPAQTSCSHNFENVPPGDYILHTKACDAAGNCTTKDTSVTVTAPPPPIPTGPFPLLGFGIVVGAIFIFLIIMAIVKPKI